MTQKEVLKQDAYVGIWTQTQTAAWISVVWDIRSIVKESFFFLALFDI